VALAAGVGIALVSSRTAVKPAPAPPRPVVAAAPPVAAPPPAPAPAIPAAPEEVEIVLRTTPAEAEVIEGTQVLGVCPVTLKRPRGDAALKLLFRHPGYKDETREILPTSDKDVEVVLAKKEAPAKASKLAHTRPEKPEPKKTPAQRSRVSDLRNPFD
jgi:hypothetical protein